MIPYIFLFLLLSILAIAEEYVKSAQRNWLFPVSILLIGVFQALRWETGTDWIPSHDFFIHSNSASYREGAGFEWGYTCLNQCIRYFTDSFTVFLLVECFLNLFFITWFAKGMKANKCMILLISFCLAVFPIRYTLASNVILCSYKYIIEKKFIPFVVLFILAFSIHRSVIVFFPIYFLARRQFSATILVAVYFTAIILGLLAEMTFGNVIQLISLFYGQIGESFQNKLDAYVTGEIPEYAIRTPVQLLLSYANSIFFILLFCYYRNKFFPKNRLYNVLLNLYVLGLSFNRIFLQIIPDFARLTSLFAGGFPIMVLMIISHYNQRIRILLLLLLLVYYYLKFRGSSFGGFYSDLFVPYYSVFFPGNRAVY